MVIHHIFRAFGWKKDREEEGRKDDAKGQNPLPQHDDATRDPPALSGIEESPGSAELAQTSESNVKLPLQEVSTSMPEAEDDSQKPAPSSCDVVPSLAGRQTPCSPREKKSISSQESAVATDVTAPATEPSHSPASSKIRTLELTTPPSEDLLLAPCDDFDIPEDLPVFIRTATVPKRRNRSIASSTSRCGSRRYDDPSQAGATNTTTTTALASSMALKHESIVQTFANIIQELNLPEDEQEQNSEDAPPNVRQQLDQAMNDQRELISELQEVISRLETDARREEAENVRLKRRLQSATRRRGTIKSSAAKSKGQRHRRRQRSSTTTQSKISKATDTTNPPQPIMFPVTEITCTPQENSFEDDLTWFDALNKPTPPPKSRGCEC